MQYVKNKLNPPLTKLSSSQWLTPAIFLTKIYAVMQ